MVGLSKALFQILAVKGEQRHDDYVCLSRFMFYVLLTAKRIHKNPLHTSPRPRQDLVNMPTLNIFTNGTSEVGNMS